MLQWLSSIVDRIILSVFCTHQWEYVKEVREQNLRAGFKHTSHVYRCKLCNQRKVIENPPSTLDL